MAHLLTHRNTPVLVLLLVSYVLWLSPVAAQSYFEAPSNRTGNNATIIVPASALDGDDQSVLSPGDEIGIFSEDGTLVGAGEWTGDSMAITIWGNNELTDEVDGLRMDERFTFCFWLRDQQREITPDKDVIEVSFATDRPHYRKKQTYAPNALYVVEHLRIELDDTSDITVR